MIGHSLGGLEATDIFVDHKQAFKSYVIIDPSLWFDNQSFMRHAIKVLHEQDFTGVSLYLGMANNLAPKIDTVQMLVDTSRENLRMRSVFQF